jgi:hypothetical protein
MGRVAKKAQGFTVRGGIGFIKGEPDIESIINSAATPIDKFNRDLNILNQALGKLPNFQAFGGGEDPAELARGAIGNAKVDLVNDTFRKLGFSTDKLREATDRYNKSLAFLENLNRNGLIHQDTYVKRVAEAGEIYRKAKDELSGLTEQTKKYQKVLDEGARLTEALRTPQQVFSDSLTNMEKLLAAGAISWGTYARGVRKAGEELRRATGADKVVDIGFRPTAALERGSSATFSAINRFQNEGGGSRRDVLLQQLAKQTEMVKLMSQFVRQKAEGAKLAIASLVGGD